MPKATAEKALAGRTTTSPLSTTIPTLKGTKKAANVAPAKSIQSALKSDARNLAPAKPAADNDPSGES